MKAAHQRCQRLENHDSVGQQKERCSRRSPTRRNVREGAVGFDELMPKTLATATVERLLHHAHVIVHQGQHSYLFARATAGKG